MKKSRTSLFRILILALIIIVVVFILAFAWFYNKKEVDASGLSIKAPPVSGLQVSFEGKDDSVWASQIADDTPKAYPLVTGSGLITNNVIDLFVPSINLSTGEPVARTDGSWIVNKQTAEANVDFFETDVYFRSTEALEVSISSDSFVKPRALMDKSDGTSYDLNLSEFGNFTRDYIAGAARIGFYDKDDNLKFVWAPNKNYQLKEGAEFVEIEKTSQATGVPHSTNPEETFNIDTLQQSNYYLWEAVTPHGGDNGNIPISSEELGRTNPQGITMRYDSSTNTYLAALDIVSTANVDHAIYPILLDKPYNDGSDFSTEAHPAGYPSSSYADAYGNYYKDALSFNCIYNNQKYTIKVYIQYRKSINFTSSSSGVDWAQMSITATADGDLDGQEFFSDVDRFQVLFGFDPTANENNGKLSVKEFIFYSTKNSNIGGGTSQAGNTTYNLTNGQGIVVTSPNKYPDTEATFAMYASNGGFSSKDITLYEANGTYKINNQSLRSGSVLTVVGTAQTGQYKLKCNISGDYYLYYNSSEDKLDLTNDSDSASVFQITNGLNFCRLKVVNSAVGDRYLDISSAGVSLSGEPAECRIFLSQGSSSGSSVFGYDFTENRPEDEKEEYKYLVKNNTSKRIETLTEISTSSVDVTRWNQIDSAESVVTDLAKIKVPLVTLTKENEADNYYKGKIKIRIWVEGTDDEARLPLVNGIFNTQLVFDGSKPTTTT